MSISDRLHLRENFLRAAGWADATRIAFPGDASTRSYARLIKGDARAILMDAPPGESPPCPPDADAAMRRAMGWNALARLAASRVDAFFAIAGHCADLGLSAPGLYAADAVHGFAVLEDFGDGVFAREIEAGADEPLLYAAAGEALARLHEAPAPELVVGNGFAWPLLSFDRLALEANADLFVNWVPHYLERGAPSDAVLARWERARDNLIDQAMDLPRAMTLRDYHAENLVWLADRDGPARVGLLDIQDAVKGWAGWDFSMLLHDARRDVSPAAAEAALGAYLDRSGRARQALEAEIALLGALNALRICGVFARLVARDGKMRYQHFMPREWAHLRRQLAQPALAEMRALVAEIAPHGLARFKESV